LQPLLEISNGFYNSDDALIYFWEQKGAKWQKQKWGQYCVRYIARSLDPPLELWAPRKRPKAFIHYETPWEWSGYIGYNIAILDNLATGEEVNLGVGKTYRNITLLKMDIARGEAQVKIDERMMTLKFRSADFRRCKNKN
jgi:hypothetical protein